MAEEEVTPEKYLEKKNVCIEIDFFPVLASVICA